MPKDANRDPDNKNRRSKGSSRDKSMKEPVLGGVKPRDPTKDVERPVNRRGEPKRDPTPSPTPRRDSSSRDKGKDRNRD